MSTNPGPNNQDTVNTFGITTDNMAFPLALKAHSAAHKAMGVSGIAKQAEVIVAGDSITATQFFNTPTHRWYEDIGFHPLAAALAGVSPTFYPYATSGLTVKGWETNWMAQTLANPAKLVIMCLGANDEFSTPPTAVAIKLAQLTSIFDRLIAAGKYLVVLSEFPQSAGTAPVALQRANGVVAQNNFVSKYFDGNPSGEYLDLYTAMTDSLGVNSPFKAGYAKIGDATLVHIGNLGAYVCGQVMTALYARLFTKYILVGSTNDIRSTNADSNQLLANPLLTGTTGTLGTNVTGAGGVATDLTVNGDANTAVVASVANANSTVGKKQVMTIISTAAGLAYGFGENVAAQISAGDYVTVAARLKISNSSHVRGFSLYWTTNSSLKDATWNHRSTAANTAWPAEMEFLVARVGAVVPAGITNLRPYFAIEFDGAQTGAAGGTGTVFEIEQLEIRNWGKVERA